MSDCCCCWQCIPKDKSRSLHQGKRDNDAHSSERHISRYLTNSETTLVNEYTSTAQFLRYLMSLRHKFVLVLTAVAPNSGVSFILSLGTVCRPVTQLIHGDTQTRGWTGPFSWVTLPWHIICRQNKFKFVRAGLQIEKGISENRITERFQFCSRQVCRKKSLQEQKEEEKHNVLVTGPSSGCAFFCAIVY